MLFANNAGWSFWLIAVISLLWNGMGAFDYVMTQTKNAQYLAQFSPEQLAFFHGFPAWVNASWAIAVWFGVLGSILLLLRRRQAVPVFLLSLVAMVLTAIHNFALSSPNMAELMGSMAIWFSVVIFLVALFLPLYAMRMRARGVLR